MKKMVVIDGNSIMFRAYYATAFTGNLMQSRSGLYTNAIYGFVNMIQHVINNLDFQNIFVAFDKGKKTLRHQEYSDYKGGRKKTPEEFLMQIPYIKEYLDVLNIQHLELDDYEADDIVGSMANLAAPFFDEIIVISGDRDLLQLAKNNIHVYLTKKGITDLDCYTEDNFFEKMGIQSSQIIDYKGLIGDSSDNLPGISGIGEKTAKKLLEEYGTLENVIANADKLTPKLKQSVINDKDLALRSKRLATLFVNIDLPYTVEDTIYKDPNYNEVRSFYEKLDFVSFIKKLNKKNNEISQIKASTQEDDILTADNQARSDDTSLVNEKNSNISYYINDISSLKDELKKTSVYSLEVEIAGENYHKDELLGIAVVINDKGFFIDKLMLQDQELINLLEDTNKTIYAVDAKKCKCALSYIGINLNNFSFDLTLGAYIVNPSFSSGDIKMIYDHFIENSLPNTENIYTRKTKYIVPDLDIYSKYAIDKCKYLALSKKNIDEKLKDNNQLALLYDMEIPLALVLADMELCGFRVNKKRLEEIGNEVNNKMRLLEKDIYSLAGEEFNISSPKQLGVILFEKLAIAKGKKNKTGYTTSADVLEKLALIHPLPKLILEYRKYSKIYNTYVVGLINEISPVDLNVHTIFKQSLTLTGRLSSTEPNIQNIPVRTDDGRMIRSAFVSSFTDGYLVSADYSQIELRILASLAGAKNMINDFNMEIDLHASTASKIFNVPLENVDKSMRRIAKAVNFGIVYGMSDWGLSEEVKITAHEANEFIHKYFEIYPEIKTYLDNVVADAKKNEYTITMFNRRRYMSEINSSNGPLRAFAERTAKNAPIQGSAADIIKLAMIKVSKRMKKEKLESKLVAQVHDELIVDCKKEELEIVKTILKEEMESVVETSVKFNVDVEYGKTWDLK